MKKIIGIFLSVVMIVSNMYLSGFATTFDDINASNVF